MINCPKCNATNTFDAKFCMTCAASLIQNCLVCEAENPITAKFCKACRGDLSALLPGLSLKEANWFKEGFGMFGITDRILSTPDPLLTTFQSTADAFDLKTEPLMWKIGVDTTHSDIYRLKYPHILEFLPNPSKEKFAHINLGLYAIRTRFILIGAYYNKIKMFSNFQLNEIAAESFWYKDIKCTCSSNGEFEVTTKIGRKLSWKLTAKGPNLLDVALVAGSNDTYSKFTSVDRVKNKANERDTVYEALQLFADAVDAVR
ncbi:zinc ribbon domain-containing protein [Candidatus Chlorohelix sp.]|uniref:zinc ribbon domain-containing protein n=1 Tax=Candidatus Chlorohelix sp. TaxID=3139201 RepID=UPI00305D7B6C